MPTVIKSYEHTSYYSLYRYLKILVFTVYAKYCNFFLLDCIKQVGTNTCTRLGILEAYSICSFKMMPNIHIYLDIG